VLAWPLPAQHAAHAETLACYQQVLALGRDGGRDRERLRLAYEAWITYLRAHGAADEARSAEAERGRLVGR